VLQRLHSHLLNRRFERKARIPSLSHDEIQRLFTAELIFPPRKDVMRPGMQTVDGLFALGSLARHVNAKLIFEIGTYQGVTTWFLAKNNPDAEVHTLDLPPEEEPLLPVEESDEFRAQRGGMYYVQHQAENVIQHWEDSATFDFSPWTGLCDLIYIDGAHSGEYVRSDTENALRLLNSAGAIVWDDYWRRSPGTTDALHHYLGEGLELRRIPGTRLVVHLPFASRP
jgi:hypothetical protein